MAFYPTHTFSEANAQWMDALALKHNPLTAMWAATNEMVERATRTYEKPTFALTQVETAFGALEVHEEVILRKPFCYLVNFKVSGASAAEKRQRPKMLVVAPLSGHFATLLRETVRALLHDFDVYITDWQDARTVPLDEGEFTLDTYVDYLLEFAYLLGPQLHVLAVCQPAVPVLMAASILAEDQSPNQFKSMTLMGGPIDARVNPGPVNLFAKGHSLAWYRDNLISEVAPYYPGAGRLVCPGYIMLGSFMSLNPERHQDATLDFFEHLLTGDEEGAQSHRAFYDEYRAVMDLPAAYFLQSIERVFQQFALPCGHMRWRYRTIRPQAIKHTALLTIEGEKDDISPPGQTQAAHHLCPHIPAACRKHYLQKGAGHYGIFSGRRWREHVYPLIRDFVFSISN